MDWDDRIDIQFETLAKWCGDGVIWANIPRDIFPNNKEIYPIDIEFSTINGNLFIKVCYTSSKAKSNDTFETTIRLSELRELHWGTAVWRDKYRPIFKEIWEHLNEQK